MSAFEPSITNPTFAFLIPLKRVESSFIFQQSLQGNISMLIHLRCFNVLNLGTQTLSHLRHGQSGLEQSLFTGYKCVKSILIFVDAYV